MSDLNAFASEMSFEEYYCAPVFFGMTSKTLYVSGLKTESEFPDVYLDFIRQHGIPSALQHDNSSSESSQRVRQINRDLVFADQLTELHCTWQNPAELNGVNYLKSYAHVLLDRTGRSDSMLFLVLDYLAYMLPMEGHLKAFKIILAYLNIVDKEYSDHSIYPIENCPNRKSF
jgi:hypothetical protein